MQFIYRQKDDGRWKASDMGDGAAVLGTVTANGACCVGIASWWIIKKSLGDNFWDWFGPPGSATHPNPGPANGKAGEPVQVIKDVLNGQKLLGEMDAYSIKLNHDAATNYIVAKSNNSLVKEQELWDLGGPVAWTVLGEAATKRLGYAFIGFNVQNWGTHAVAAHILPNGSIEWMDSNIGEVEKTDNATLGEWLERDVAKIYGSAPLTNARVQLLELTRPDGTLPPAPAKLHEM